MRIGNNGIATILQDKMGQVLILAFSVIFGLVKSLSEHIYINNEINIDISFGIYSLICYLLLNISYWTITQDYKVRNIDLKYLRKLKWIFSIILLCSYVICWLAWWPGTAFIDSWYISLYGLPISSQHPIFYCAYIKLLTHLGYLMGGFHYVVILNAVIQILLSVTIISLILSFINKIRISLLIKFSMLLIYALIPVYAMYAICLEKSVFWALAVTLFSFLIYLISSGYNKKLKLGFWVLFDVCIVFITLFRNNGVYILFPTLLALFIVFSDIRRKILISFIIVIISLIVSLSWLHYLEVRPLFQEKIGIPLQQIAAVVKNEGTITDDQKEFINKIMPLDNLANRYDPYNVDSIKWTDRKFGFSNTFLSKNKTEFFKVWLEILPKNFKIYIQSYLQATYGFWAPKNIKNIVITDKLPKKGRDTTWLRNWILDNGYTETQWFPISINNILLAYYSTPFILGEGMLFWLLLACALLYYLKNRKISCLIIYLPCILLWLTIMLATPIAASFRYMLSFAYLLPFFTALLFVERDKNN